MAACGEGAIINLGSWLARLGIQAASASNATKGAVETLTRDWAAEFGPAGVRVNAIAPGVIQNPTFGGAPEGADFAMNGTPGRLRCARAAPSAVPREVPPARLLSGAPPGSPTAGGCAHLLEGWVRTWRRSPWGPNRPRASAGPGPGLPNQCGVWVSNSATSPAVRVRSCSPSSRRRRPDRT